MKLRTKGMADVPSWHEPQYFLSKEEAVVYLATQCPLSARDMATVEIPHDTYGGLPVFRVFRYDPCMDYLLYCLSLRWQTRIYTRPLLTRTLRQILFDRTILYRLHTLTASPVSSVKQVPLTF